MAESTNLIDVIVTDHRLVEDLFGQLEKREGSDDARRALLDDVLTNLVRHSVAEEMYLYPAAREALTDGDQIADHEIEEHTDAERTMKELETLEPSDPDFERLVGELITDVRHHMAEEENNLLPRLREHCSTDDLEDLGRKVEDAKQIAPTRPHPDAPHGGTAQKALAPGTGLIDRVRDALTS